MSASVVPTGPVSWWKEAISAEHYIPIAEVVADLPAVQHNAPVTYDLRLGFYYNACVGNAMRESSRQTLYDSTTIAHPKGSTRPSSARSKILDAAKNWPVSAISVENAGAKEQLFTSANRTMLSRPNAHCPERMRRRGWASHGTSEARPDANPTYS
jgi:hypothetical protein